MREKKKVLQFKKFKVANLNRILINGGARENTLQEDVTKLKTDEGITECHSRYNGMCTEGATVTEIQNGCTEGDEANQTNNNCRGQQVSG
ncbi:MAG: hypothetical protein AAF611_20165 [Bacteroidota bacterium]